MGLMRNLGVVTPLLKRMSDKAWVWGHLVTGSQLAIQCNWLSAWQTFSFQLQTCSGEEDSGVSSSLNPEAAALNPGHFVVLS